MSAATEPAAAAPGSPPGLGDDALEAVPVALFVTDAEGAVVAVNARAEQLARADRAALIGARLETLLHGTRPPAPGAPPVEARLGPPGADPNPVEVASGPQGAAGPDRTCVAVRDLSARRRAEAELRDSMEQLERSAAERRKLLAAIVGAQEEERARIAADMHDDTIQAITAAHIRLQLVAAEVADPGPRASLEQLQEAVGGALNRLRRLAFELRPPSLDNHGLRAAVEEHLERLQLSTGTEARIEDRLGGEPPEDVRIVLYRVANEALVNVGKHARATAVVVRLRRDDHGYELEVADDGTGPGDYIRRPQPGHLGLATMRERVEAAGGRLTVGEAAEGGTRVVAWMPGERRRRPRPDAEVRP